MLNTALPVLADFWAEKCSPCPTNSSILEGLAEETDGKVKFVRIDPAENRDIAAATASVACLGESSRL